MIEVQNLSLSLGKREVLKGISFSLEKGSALGICGSMGSGKSSLLYSIKGIIPSLMPGKISGKIIVGGQNGSGMRRNVGIVFQNPNDQIFSNTLYEEVEFGLKNFGFKGEDLRARTENALQQVGLLARKDENPFELSQGQRQKLTIASVLAIEPEVILLDEPASNLDHRTSLEVYRMLSSLKERGKTILVVEHDTDLLHGFADKFLVLDEGKQVAFGGEEVFSHPHTAKAGVKIPWKQKAKQA
jgi:energy-coupling factor transporter ATP-binding protein EcfA2